MRELYIYWKLPSEELPQALQRVRSLQAGIRGAHPGLQARLLVRADLSASGQATLMEIYARPGSPAGVDAALQQVVEAAAALALGSLAAGPRHVEVFESVPA